MHEIERLKAESEAARAAMASSQPDITDVEETWPDDEPVPTIVGVTENEFLTRVIDFVNDHLEEGDFGLENMADHFAMSVSTLRRRLQDATGVSPKSYIQAIQMQRACNLLDSGLQIADVAMQCGFTEPGSFTRTFKRVLGLTPSQYRTRA
jgi:AraC-like DNA-binding protein